MECRQHVERAVCLSVAAAGAVRVPQDRTVLHRASCLQVRKRWVEPLHADGSLPNQRMLLKRWKA